MLPRCSLRMDYIGGLRRTPTMEEPRESVERAEIQKDVASEAPPPEPTAGEHRQRDMEARRNALVRRGEASEAQPKPLF